MSREKDEFEIILDSIGIMLIDKPITGWLKLLTIIMAVLLIIVLSSRYW